MNQTVDEQRNKMLRFGKRMAAAGFIFGLIAGLIAGPVLTVILQRAFQ